MTNENVVLSDEELAYNLQAFTPKRDQTENTASTGPRKTTTFTTRSRSESSNERLTRQGLETRTRAGVPAAAYTNNVQETRNHRGQQQQQRQEPNPSSTAQPANRAPESAARPEPQRVRQQQPGIVNSGNEHRLRKRCLLVAALLVTICLCGLFTGVFFYLTSSPTRPPIQHELPPSNITVGAYYYPWYGSNFHGRRYIRGDLGQAPSLGEYDDSDPQVIDQHLQWSFQANIQFWVTSWWGQGRREDLTIRNVILPHLKQHREYADFKIALFYETTGRIKSTTDLENVVPDMQHICRTYFQHENYLRVSGRPVVFVYLTRKLFDQGILGQVVDLMRSTALRTCQEDVYLVGDHVWKRAPPDDEVYPPFQFLDAVTNYDVYGNLNARQLYASKFQVDVLLGRQRQWKERANAAQCGFIPAVSPGFNDRGVRLQADHLPLSRQMLSTSSNLEEEERPGSLFEYTVQEARFLVDPSANNMLMVNSFNEWHEDTQIEPVKGNPKSEPDILTKGLTYYGYGDLYLEILRNGTRDEEEEDVMTNETETKNGTAAKVPEVT